MATFLDEVTDDIFVGFCCAKKIPMPQYQVVQANSASSPKGSLLSSTPKGGGHSRAHSRPSPHSQNGHPPHFQAPPAAIENLRRGLSTQSRSTFPSDARHPAFKGANGDVYIVDGFNDGNVLVKDMRGSKFVSIRSCRDCTVQVMCDIQGIDIEASRNVTVNVSSCSRGMHVTECISIAIVILRDSDDCPAVRIVDCLDVTLQFPSGSTLPEKTKCVESVRSTNVITKGREGSSLQVY